MDFPRRNVDNVYRATRCRRLLIDALRGSVVEFERVASLANLRMIKHVCINTDSRRDAILGPLEYTRFYGARSRKCAWKPEEETIPATIRLFASVFLHPPFSPSRFLRILFGEGSKM